ncbi:MAG TPA: PepSY-associated TM helix domain-containing protein [Rhizomicrobium sp.]|jgi:uncharacterized iron-regulated membrane protein|nr:PepSY-associated TM helix domain-containing protein [Rhizomicrobium sp.]
MSTASTVRKFLFPLHLWVGLTLGIVIVLIGLSGSIGVFDRLFSEPPTVQVTPASTPALNKGLAAARAAVGAPQWANASITLPKGVHDPVIISFGDQLPDVATDPSTGQVLATYIVREPAWFTAILRFHGGLLLPGPTGGIVEGWLGLAMIFLGLTGLYLWWPKTGRWKYAFIVRRTAKGLRFHRELHGAAGIWALVIYLLVTTTGLVYGFPETTDAVIKFVTGETNPRLHVHKPPTVPTSAGAAIIGPDAALVTANKASGRPVLSLRMPGWKLGQPSLMPIIAQTDVGAMNRVYLDPYHNTIIPNPDPPNSAYNMEAALVRLHVAYDFGPIYTVLVFISGLMPLIFFVTGVVMWLKKRQARLAMNQPIPDSAMEG